MALEKTAALMPLKVKPYEHQVRAFKFACELLGAMPSEGNLTSTGVALLCEMGCGKTVMAIAIIGYLYLLGKIKRLLIVAPLSIVSVWRDSFDDFAAFPYELTVLSGNSAKKKRQITEQDGKGLQVLVINYESAWRLESALLVWGPEAIICDEGHKLKEARTAQSKAMHNLGDKASYKLLLTGTLITNKEIDVFSQYRFCEKRVFGTSFYAFRNEFFEMTGYGNHIPKFRQSKTEDFLKRMHSIAFRCTKEECLDLPGITEEIVKVELEPAAQKIYKELEKESYTELANSEVTAANVLTKLLRLSQVCGGHLTSDSGETNVVSTAKLEVLSELVDSVLEQGKKVVVMARFVLELEDIQKLLEKKKVKYAVIRGGVRDRDLQIKNFQEDDECKVFLGQIAAAGLGVTLTAASTMIFYSLDYSMSNFEQAKARIHRISQKENCHYIYLVAKNTVDVKVLRALRNKVNLAKALVDDYRAGRNPYKED